MSNVRPETMERITTKALADKFIEEQIQEVRAQVGDKKVLLALSGGVDSSVAAVLLHKAIGNNLTCVFVDHGLLRKNEGDFVEATFGKKFGIPVIRVYAEERFLKKLKLTQRIYLQNSQV